MYKLKKVCVLTLGCKVNKYESDEIIRNLCGIEFEIVTRLEKADVYVVNTCAVTSYAEKKSRYEVSRIVRLDPNARIIVCGCASQLNAAQFKSSNVVKVFGTDKSEVAKCVTELF